MAKSISKRSMIFVLLSVVVLIVCTAYIWRGRLNRQQMIATVYLATCSDYIELFGQAPAELADLIAVVRVSNPSGEEAVSRNLQYSNATLRCTKMDGTVRCTIKFTKWPFYERSTVYKLPVEMD